MNIFRSTDLAPERFQTGPADICKCLLLAHPTFEWIWGATIQQTQHACFFHTCTLSASAAAQCSQLPPSWPKSLEKCCCSACHIQVITQVITCLFACMESSRAKASRSGCPHPAPTSPQFSNNYLKRSLNLTKQTNNNKKS